MAWTKNRPPSLDDFRRRGHSKARGWYNYVDKEGYAAAKDEWRMIRQQQAEDAAASASAAPAAPAAPAIDMDAIRSKLKGQEEEFIAAQTANIDRDAERNLAQGMSNMIGSGLAGTTVVGGMQAGVQEVATRAKGDVAARASAQTEQLAAQYANLQQAASEAAANRAFQGQQNQLSRAHQIRLADMNNAARATLSTGGGGVRPSTPGLDVFGKPLAGSVQDIQLQRQQMADYRASRAKKYPNLGLVGQSAPNLF